jgi:uncharacterized membrane protein YdbT with pleckstrin-like domain
MPYCLKCGTKVEESMTFCPNCGTQLKGDTPSTATAPEPSQKQEKAEETLTQQKPAGSDKGKRQEKAEHGFIRYLVSGLILITVGVSAILELTNPAIASGTLLAIVLLTIGLIVILGSVYYALSGRKHDSSVPIDEPSKKPAQPAA